MFVKAWFEHSSQSTFDHAPYQIDTHVVKSRSKLHMEEPREERLPVMERHVREARAQDKPIFMIGGYQGLARVMSERARAELTLRTEAIHRGLADGAQKARARTTNSQSRCDA